MSKNACVNVPIICNQYRHIELQILAQILATIFAWIPSAHILVWIEITALVVSCVQ